MEQWVLLRKGADFEGIGKRFQISPRLACLIRNRDVIGDEAIAQYLNCLLYTSDKYISRPLEKQLGDRSQIMAALGDKKYVAITEMCIRDRDIDSAG